MSIHLGPGPVIPPLSVWTQERLSAVIQATTKAAFDEAFDNFVARNCNITVNGVHLSRDQYKQQLRSEELLEASAEVKFDGTVEVPKDQKSPVEAGLVGLFYEATINSALLVDAAPEQSKITSSLNVIIAQDKSFTGAVHGYFDARRVVTLNQVFVDRPVPISFPTSSA